MGRYTMMNSVSFMDPGEAGKGRLDKVVLIFLGDGDTKDSRESLEKWMLDYGVIVPIPLPDRVLVLKRGKVAGTEEMGDFWQVKTRVEPKWPRKRAQYEYTWMMKDGWIWEVRLSDKNLKPLLINAESFFKSLLEIVRSAIPKSGLSRLAKEAYEKAMETSVVQGILKAGGENAKPYSSFISSYIDNFLLVLLSGKEKSELPIETRKLSEDDLWSISKSLPQIIDFVYGTAEKRETTTVDMNSFMHLFPHLRSYAGENGLGIEEVEVRVWDKGQDAGSELVMFLLAIKEDWDNEPGSVKVIPYLARLYKRPIDAVESISGKLGIGVEPSKNFLMLGWGWTSLSKNYGILLDGESVYRAIKEDLERGCAGKEPRTFTGAIWSMHRNLKLHFIVSKRAEKVPTIVDKLSVPINRKKPLFEYSLEYRYKDNHIREEGAEAIKAIVEMEKGRDEPGPRGRRDDLLRDTINRLKPIKGAKTYPFLKEYAEKTVAVLEAIDRVKRGVPVCLPREGGNVLVRGEKVFGSLRNYLVKRVMGATGEKASALVSKDQYNHPHTKEPNIYITKAILEKLTCSDPEDVYLEMVARVWYKNPPAGESYTNREIRLYERLGAAGGWNVWFSLEHPE